MSDSATIKSRLKTLTPLLWEAAFDGGICWLAKADSELGLCKTIADLRLLAQALGVNFEFTIPTSRQRPGGGGRADR